MRLFEIFPLASFLILGALISGRIIFLKRKGIKVSQVNSGRKKLTLFLYPIFSFLMLLWLFELAKPAFQISISMLPETITNYLKDSLYLKIAGVSLVSAAFVFLLLSLLHFKNSLRFGFDEKNKGTLITSGVFSISRNPFFLSLELYFIGIAFLLPNLFLIGFSILAITGIHFFILKEEKIMRNMYGSEYEEYAKNVRRYF